MGRTVPSFRMALEAEIGSWSDFGRALKGGSRNQLEELFRAARTYCSASSNAVRPVRFQGMFMAMAFEHERRIEGVAREIEKMRVEINAGD
jgi:hypothetical protein